MFNNITLEMSLKPFKRTDSESITSVVRKMFEQWNPLLKNRRVISVLLWTADGSEILDYSGNMDDEFEWCKFVGGANNQRLGENDPLEISLHERKIPYIEHPPIMTYRILKEIISEIKAEGKRLFPDATIRVGETFDIGPEFAKSDFKYNRHKEICTGTVLDQMRFLNSYGVLDGDNRHYAGFPDGIPDKTPFGTFLGRQTKLFFEEIGFDYLWLSNGVGFSAYPWSSEGAIFDGKKFNTDKFNSVKEELFHFWKRFRKECTDYPVEVRGTNYSAGIDYASDAVPLYDIYHADLNIMPPPNSPWAALDGDFGLELMGHMTRICELPGEDFLFRYYIHDPWWANSPWYDRYEGQPHDIYMPMSLSRIDQEGNIKSASVLNILTIDNSFGDMPDACVNEPLPHILKAEKDAPDEIAPFVWVYPFREYTTTQDATYLRKIMSGDWFICEAITNGLPLTSIVSCDNFMQHDKMIYKKSVLVTPVPKAESTFEKVILSYAKTGGKVIFYGSVDHASDTFKNTFGIEIREGKLGEVEINKKYYFDINKDGSYPETMKVREFISDGSVNTTSNASLVTTKDGDSLAAEYQNALWFRATIGGEFGGRHIIGDEGSKILKSEVIFRKLLEKFGYSIRFVKPSGDVKTPMILLHRSNNATIFSTYAPNTTVETMIKCPLGAPILNGYEAEIKDGAAGYRFPRADHRECRVFVEQESGIVSACEEIPVSHKYRRRIRVNGLKNATVRFFGEEYCKEHVEAVLNSFPDSFPACDDFEYRFVKSEEYGTYLEVVNVTGKMVFHMPFAKYVT